MGQRSAEHAVDMVQRYARAATARDVDSIVALFAEDAEVKDPFDAAVLTGRDAIRDFFQAGVPLIDKVSVAGPVGVTADAASAAAPMRAEVTIDGQALEMDTVDVFFFDESGLFSAMHAFYGPTNARPR